MTVPFRCYDSLCGQEDCARCHPENFIYNEEEDYYYFTGETEEDSLENEEDGIGL